MQPSLLLQPFFAMPDLILKSVSPLSTAKSVNLPLKAIFFILLDGWTGFKKCTSVKPQISEEKK